MEMSVLRRICEIMPPDDVHTGIAWNHFVGEFKKDDGPERKTVKAVIN
jgi:hypothetical protein